MAHEESSDKTGVSKSGQNGPKVIWNDAQMRSSYANVCNASSTREEVVLVFGINQAWHGGQKQVEVQVNDRVILSPFAAKRLSILLNKVVDEYEKRFGALPEVGGSGETARSLRT